MRTRLTFLATLVVALGLLLPAAALAYAPSDEDFLTCVEQEGNVIDCVAGVVDERCPAKFTVVVDDTTVAEGTATADDDGEVEFSFDFDATDGAAPQVTLECPGDEPLVLSGTIERAPGGDGDGQDAAVEGDLAQTGVDSATLALGALGAILIGGGALFISRRRRSDGA